MEDQESDKKETRKNVKCSPEVFQKLTELRDKLIQQEQEEKPYGILKINFNTLLNYLCDFYNQHEHPQNVEQEIRGAEETKKKVTELEKQNQGLQESIQKQKQEVQRLQQENKQLKPKAEKNKEVLEQISDTIKDIKWTLEDLDVDTMFMKKDEKSKELNRRLKDTENKLEELKKLCLSTKDSKEHTTKTGPPTNKK